MKAVADIFSVFATAFYRLVSGKVVYWPYGNKPKYFMSLKS